MTVEILVWSRLFAWCSTSTCHSASDTATNVSNITSFDYIMILKAFFIWHLISITIKVLLCKRPILLRLSLSSMIIQQLIGRCLVVHLILSNSIWCFVLFTHSMRRLYVHLIVDIILFVTQASLQHIGILFTPFPFSLT